MNNAGEIATSKRNLKEANRIHLKYVDDITLAESIDLKEKLILADSDRKNLMFITAELAINCPYINRKYTSNFLRLKNMLRRMI